MATSFALGAGSFVRPSIPWGYWAFSFLSYAIKAPWSWGIAFWAFCTGLICGAVRRLLHIYEGSLGRIGNTAPSSSDVIPMSSNRFALRPTGHIVRASLAQNRISTLEISERPKSISSAPQNLYIAPHRILPMHQEYLKGAQRREGRARAGSGIRRGASKPVFGALCRPGS
jgi:hypothetical protein